MCTRRWIAIFALLAVVVVATGCAATENQEDEGAMSPQPIATVLVITGSQASPTSAPSMSASADAPIRYQATAVMPEFAELLRHGYWVCEGNVSDIETHAHRLHRLLPDDAAAAGFADLVSIAARIRQVDTGS